MAEVTSGKNMTVIVLNNNEASALVDVLGNLETEDYIILDELTNTMLGNKNLVGSCEEGEEGWIGPGPVPTDWCGT